MQLSVTFRHMDSTDALREYAKEKVERIRKYFPDPIKAHVVLVCDRGYNHTADVMITLHNGLVIKGVETTEDMYSSIDLVMAKIERQVRRYKEKIRSHKGAEGLHGQREIIHSVLAEPADVEGGGPANGHAHALEPEIIKKSKFFAKPLSPNEAVMQMNLLNNDFLVFTNASSHEVNVVYRRGDGTYGLIETGQNDNRQGGKA
ncbi:MAG TPA: ribosome-associated translation inhibitor RaiA [Polyangia bacterium]|nr:ribosome-associated translation inhibitor RaiA [Polyangia bacterium]